MMDAYIYTHIHVHMFIPTGARRAIFKTSTSNMPAAKNMRTEYRANAFAGKHVLGDECSVLYTYTYTLTYT